MKANELRIGNWIKEESNYVRQWRPSDFAIYLNRYKEEIIDKIEGIPLTPEILEKSGFTTDNDLFMGATVWYKEYLQVLIKDNKYFTIMIYGFPANPARGYYLHQLQNIYFALNGEELEYKGDKL